MMSEAEALCRIKAILDDRDKVILFNCMDKEPNITHRFIKKLEDEGKLLGVITQNVDGLDKKRLEHPQHHKDDRPEHQKIGEQLDAQRHFVFVKPSQSGSQLLSA